MTNAGVLRLEIIPFWKSLQDDLRRIIDLLPEDMLDATPKSGLWNPRGILIHVSDVRDQWLANGIKDGDPYPNIWQTARAKEDLRHELDRTFERLMRLLLTPARMDAAYPDPGNPSRMLDGHWLAFQLLEHDIHHRSELLQRLALLNINHGIDL